MVVVVVVVVVVGSGGGGGGGWGRDVSYAAGIIPFSRHATRCLFRISEDCCRSGLFFSASPRPFLCSRARYPLWDSGATKMLMLHDHGGGQSWELLVDSLFGPREAKRKISYPLRFQRPPDVPWPPPRTTLRSITATATSITTTTT